MKTCLIALSCWIALAGIMASAQSADAGYGMATVVSIERVANDAQHPENVDNYRMSMRMDNVLYLCHATAPAAEFLNWSPGKQFPARENGKLLEVKNMDGQILELKIVKRKPS